MLRYFKVLLLVAGLCTCQPALSAATTNVVDLSYTVGAGNVPTLTWSAPWATSCSASGSWSGTKAASGSETLPAITGTVSYTLTCLGPMDDKATLSWDAPTKYTDGTSIGPGELGSYKVYRGNSASSLVFLATVPTLSYIDSNLLAGTKYYAVSATTTAGVESALSSVGSKTIQAAPSGSDVEVIKVPNPPGLAATIQ